MAQATSAKKIKTTVGSIFIKGLPWNPPAKPKCPEHKIEAMAYQGAWHCPRCNWWEKQ